MVELVSMHVPKCAGTTLARALEAAYGQGQVLWDSYEISDPAFVANFDRAGFLKRAHAEGYGYLAGKRAVHGHFPIGKYAALGPDVRRITFLREPVDRLISHYFFMKTLPPSNTLRRYVHDNDVSLLDFASIPMVSKYYSSTMFGGLDISTFDFVGFHETFEADMQSLSRLIGLPLPCGSENRNPTENYTAIKDEVLADTRQVERLRSLLHNDIKLYNCFRSRFGHGGLPCMGLPDPRLIPPPNSDADPRHHLLIAGTGRAGTTLLVQLLDGCGLDTHLSGHRRPEFDTAANAGYEDLLLAPDAPYVVKSPWSHAFVDACLRRQDVTIDVAIIPVRNLEAAAASRVIVELQDRYTKTAKTMVESGRAWDQWGTVPGGMTYAVEPLDQQRILAVGFHKLLESLTRFDIPVILLDFPRFVRDPDYLFAKLAPVIGDRVDQARFTDIFHRLASPDMVRVEGEGGLVAPLPGDGPGETADRLALEMAALHRVVTSLQARNASADTVAEQLRRECERLRQERAALAQETEELRIQHGAAVATAARLGGELAAESARLVGEVTRLQDERDGLALIAAQVHAERDELVAQNNHWRDVCTGLDAKIADAKTDGAQILAQLSRQGVQQQGLLEQLVNRRTSRRRLDWQGLVPKLRGAWFGLFHGASLQRLFDPVYYLARHGDVAASGVNPLQHYLRHGGFEGRNPSPLFDSAFYLAQNPDVARQRVNPLRHYLNYGWREGRDPNPFFDTSFYLDQLEERCEPLAHYLDHGAALGCQPSSRFDAAAYLAANPDVAAAGLNPLLHYLEFGRAEGRDLPMAAPLPVRRDGDGWCLVLVQHGLGGGVHRHCCDMETLLVAEGATVWRLESLADGIYCLRNDCANAERTYADEHQLLADLRRIRPDLIHVHHSMGYGARLGRWLDELALPYDVTIHDYAFFCPRVTLLDGSGHYCGDPQDAAVCDRCVAGAGAHPGVQAAFDAVGSVAVWREHSGHILAAARRVYVPDQDVADRLHRQFPQLSPVLRPHPEAAGSVPVRPPVGGARIRIAVIGSIGPHKGFAALLACARAAQRDRLALTFVVIGEVCAPDRLAGLDTIEVTGRYGDDRLAQIIAQAGCHAALFLSVWPETYMYTLSAALRAGLFPMVLDLGAPARRLRHLGWGAVLPLGLAPTEMNARLMQHAMNHPIPPPQLALGQHYASLLRDYYQLED